MRLAREALKDLRGRAIQLRSILGERGDWTALTALLMVAIVLRVLALIVFPGVHHPDEEFQMFEQAHRFAFGYGVIPWEFEEGIRSPLPPLAISGVFRLAAAFVDSPRVYIAAARLALAAISLVSVVALFFMGLRRSPAHAIIVGVVGATWFELVYFSYRPLSEAISIEFVLIAISIASCRTTDVSRAAATAFGFCLAIAVLLRIQFAIGGMILALWVAQDKGFRCRWLACALGASLPVAAFGLADWIAWGVPFESYFNAIRVNLFEGVASNYGIREPTWYFGQAFLMYSWAIVVLGALLLIPNRDSILWILVGMAIVFVHSAIPHKEYRFAFGGFVCLVIAAAMNSAVASIKVSKSLGIDERKVIAATAAIWVATSVSLAYGGGFAGIWARQRLSVQSAMPLSARPDLCGLLLYKQPTRGYAFIHRNIPIYRSLRNRINLEAADGAVVEPDWEAFNYVIASRRYIPEFAPRFEPQICFGDGKASDPCVLRSPNACASSTQMAPLLGERQFGKNVGDVSIQGE